MDLSKTNGSASLFLTSNAPCHKSQTSSGNDNHTGLFGFMCGVLTVTTVTPPNASSYQY